MFIEAPIFATMRSDAMGSSQTKPDWWWIQQVARAMGFNLKFTLIF